MKTTQTEARLYVGTYAKYNDGVLFGKWFDLSDYSSKEEFLAACYELHEDEADPELMFQDFEGFPKSFYHESSVPDELWDWLALDESDREILALYKYAVNEDGTIEDARDSFAGTAESEAAFAENMAEELGEIPKDFPAWIQIDWQGSWNGGLRFDYISVRHNGQCWFFRR